PEKSAGGEEMVQDPVCGTYVPASDAVWARIGGKRLCFCSEECRDAYRAGKR
ncbi:MAG: YHS domain-containing protein, partial [Deltaproteobacteria bacterium]